MNNASHHNGSFDKTRGHTNETLGKVKEKIGAAIGDRELEAKGQAQIAEGKAQRAKGELKDAVDEAVDKVKAGLEVVADRVKDAFDKH